MRLPYIYNIELNSGKKIAIEGISFSKAFQFITQDISKPNYTFEIIEDNIALISYNSCTDYQKFSSFLDSTFKYIKSNSIKKTIIDLRYNSGGNSSLNDRLLSYLTRKKYRQSSGRYWKVSQEIKDKITKDSLWSNFLDKVFLKKYLNSKNQSVINDINFVLIKNKKPLFYYKGKHCFLIGPYTFSSANFLADAIKTYKLSKLIGTSTGELTNDFGELVEFQLPNSKFYFFVPTTYDIGAIGNKKIKTPVTPHIHSIDNKIKEAIKYLESNKK